MRTPPYTRRVERRSSGEAAVLLAVLGAGVFLAGLELMVTAVALPAIIGSLAGWTRLREASWIINGYLLVYVVTMPLAGRLGDLWGIRRPFLAALAIFTLGSAMAGAAQSLEQLIAARLVQAVGGGALVPLATAAAAHLFSGAARPRALGVIGALTFLGMAAGPFLGAAILDLAHPDAALARLGHRPGIGGGGLRRPGLAVDLLRQRAHRDGGARHCVGRLGRLGHATTPGPRRPRRCLPRRPGADRDARVAHAARQPGPAAGEGGLDPVVAAGVLAVLALAAIPLAIAHGLRTRDPFLDPRLFRRPAFASAALVSLLTGYGLATAIVGAAVFVDRVLYGGPDQQRLALGSLAAATAVGALASGLALRALGLRLVTVAGLAASVGGLLLMAGWTPATSIVAAAAALALFGAGFGLTVTPRSTAATEAVDASAYGAAASVVTVSRMAGMAVGLAILTAYGSTTIDRLYDQVYATADAYKQFIPDALRDRPLKDGQVVAALEAWAAREAAQIMVGVFLLAAAVTAAAVIPALLLGGRRRILGRTGAPAPSGGPDADAASISEQRAGRWPAA